MKTYNDLLHSYRKEMEEKDIPSATLKAFLFEVCNEKNINLYLNIDNEVDKGILAKFNSGMERILNQEPMNYVLGYSWFYGYRFNVNEDVLIPRYETEELAGLILEKVDLHYKNASSIVAADIGTGSGALAITLKKEEERFKMYASDISKKAVKVASRNAKELGCDVEFMVGDMLAPIKEKNIKLDILVSNPPYIPEEEVLEESVVDYEPHVALFGGKDGLKFYRILLSEAKDVMKQHGFIFFEIGYQQKENMTALAKQYFKDAEINCYKDINGKDRMFEIHF